MGEWSELTECLVELDFSIEELESWATRPEDIAKLEELERLRDDVQTALALHHIPARLRRRLSEHADVAVSGPATNDPRD